MDQSDISGIFSINKIAIENASSPLEHPADHILMVFLSFSSFQLFPLGNHGQMYPTDQLL